MFSLRFVTSYQVLDFYFWKALFDQQSFDNAFSVVKAFSVNCSSSMYWHFVCLCFVTNKEICLVSVVFIYAYSAVLFVRSATD